MVKLRGISVDNGGSELRTRAVGEDELRLHKNIVAIDEKSFRPKEVDVAESVIRITSAPDSSICGLYASGAAGSLYENKMITVTSQEEKTSTEDFYKQFIYSIAQDAYHARLKDGAFMLSKGIKESKDTIYEYAAVVCIPIKEHSGSKDCASMMKAKLAGTYEVEYPLVDGQPRVWFRLIDNQIGVIPEGGTAITILSHAIQDDDLSIVVDMGHITTDIGVYEGHNLKGKVSSPGFAGSTLCSNLRSRLIDEGYRVSESQIDRVLKTGVVRVGSTDVDVKDIIRDEEELFVKNYLKPEIVAVLNRNAINAKEIQNFIPLGAPMNKHAGMDYSVIQSTIINECGLNEVKVHIVADDLRYVNISVAHKFAKKLVSKLKSKYAAVV